MELEADSCLRVTVYVYKRVATVFQSLRLGCSCWFVDFASVCLTYVPFCCTGCCGKISPTRWNSRLALECGWLFLSIKEWQLCLSHWDWAVHVDLLILPLSASPTCHFAEQAVMVKYHQQDGTRGCAGDCFTVSAHKRVATVFEPSRLGCSCWFLGCCVYRTMVQHITMVLKTAVSAVCCHGNDQPALMINWLECKTTCVLVHWGSTNTTINKNSTSMLQLHSTKHQIPHTTANDLQTQQSTNTTINKNQWLWCTRAVVRQAVHGKYHQQDRIQSQFFPVPWVWLNSQAWLLQFMRILWFKTKDPRMRTERRWIESL